jgi:hypothetical protein
MLIKLVTLILCLLIATACSSVNTHGLNTRDQTIPVYTQKW